MYWGAISIWNSYFKVLVPKGLHSSPINRKGLHHCKVTEIPFEKSIPNPFANIFSSQRNSYKRIEAEPCSILCSKWSFEVSTTIVWRSSSYPLGSLFGPPLQSYKQPLSFLQAALSRPHKSPPSSCINYVIFIVVIKWLLLQFDENQQAPLKDPLHVPVGPITRARSKKIKAAFNGLIQDIWADSTIGHSKLGPKEDEGVINLIQDIDGADPA